MTYIAYQTAGHFEEGASFLDLMWDRLPRFRQFAKEFFGTDGAAVPGVMSLAGQPLGGWPHYSLSPSQGAWIGHLFYLHCVTRPIPPSCASGPIPGAVRSGLCLYQLLHEEGGTLRLPLSSSPEIFDNRLRAFLKPNSNYDIACLRMFFLALAEMAQGLRRRRGGPKMVGNGPSTWGNSTSARTEHAQDLRRRGPAGSHRHLSNLIGIYPFISSRSRAASGSGTSSGLRWRSGIGWAPAPGAATASAGWPASAPAPASPSRLCGTSISS